MFEYITIDAIVHNKFILFAWWVLILILVGFVLGRVIHKVQRLIIKIQETSFPKDDKNNNKRALTLTQVATWLFQAAVWISIAVLIGNRIGIPVQVLTLFSTVFGAGLGFGLQSLFKDVISSVVHISERSINVGDYIAVETSSGIQSGTVEKVSLRHIQLSSEQDGKIIVPQGTINVIKNYNEGIGQFLIDLYFDTDIELSKVLNMIQSIVDDVNNEESLEPYIDADDKPFIEDVFTVKLRGISDVSQGRMKLQLEGQTEAGKQFAAKRALLKIITNKLYDNGITYHSGSVKINTEGE